jgi:hypothetical protein
MQKMLTKKEKADWLNFSRKLEKYKGQGRKPACLLPGMQELQVKDGKRNGYSAYGRESSKQDKRVVAASTGADCNASGGYQEEGSSQGSS